MLCLATSTPLRTRVSKRFQRVREIHKSVVETTREAHSKLVEIGREERQALSGKKAQDKAISDDESLLEINTD